jgi:hypothetical protein
MLSTRYCGLRVHEPLTIFTVKKLENKALKIMLGAANCSMSALSQAGTNIQLNASFKLKAFEY